ncbi:hypothetical protein AB0A63_31320 [Lentzea sp. NPDC042327]|uniref:hypothetical protein n=1 Tax=Lentzea sp. NPDC042327 TaxID=3154801 RepID=UPI0033C3647F
MVPDQHTRDQEPELALRREAQDRLWRDGMCRLALAVRRMWMTIGESLHLTEDQVHAVTNLAKVSGDNTVSISELAKVSDLSFERAATAIDALLERRMAVRAFPRAGEPVQDRRVRLRGDLVEMIFEYYRLHEDHRGLLDGFSPADFDLVSRLLDVATSIADDKARAIGSGEVNPGAQLQDLLDGTG